MTAPCAELEAYLDETLDEARRERFEEHLLGCASCQAKLEDAMQLIAAGAELARRPDRPRAAATVERARPARRRVGLWAAAAVAIAAAVVAVVWWRARGQEHGPTIEERIAASLAPRRSLALRLPYAPLDRYRPYDVERGASAPELVPLGLTAEVEAKRPTAALVALLLARRDFDQAEAILARAGRRAGHDDDLELGRAALALARKQAASALVHLDGVLARAPASAVALWNRALVLSELQLPLAAAEAFDVAGTLGEPGWSAEAAERAASLREAERARVAQWQAGKACEAMPAGRLPDRAVVRAHTSACRPSFYEAVRVATTRDALLALMPIAEELDASVNSTAAADLVRRVAAVEPARRQRAVATYLRLTRTADLPAAEKLQLLDQLRAAEQNDLVLGAIPRSQLPGLRDEYIRRARAASDPFFAELAEERSADALLAGGDPLGAEVVLLRAVRACSGRDVELRCTDLHLALANVYEIMHRPSDVRAVAQAGIERSRRLGLYWGERLFFDYIAKAARFERAYSLMRVYLREATLRAAGECAQARYHQELMAEASLEELRFDQARRDLGAAPTCDEPPKAARARVIAELARIDGSPEEARALRAGLAQSRQQPDRTAGELAYFDALEGRLLAARDPAAARPLLRRAIEAADQLGRGDADAALARRDAYGSLLVLTASGGDPAASLALFVEAAGAPPREGACVVGAMVDAERVLVVVRDARGALAQHFEPRGLASPVLDAAALIPVPMVRALSACSRVDVLALPPVFGLPNLLPPELAWSYRGRLPSTGRGVLAAAAPAARPTVVTVADAIPPPELRLAPLGVRRLAPIPGATHVDLTGAAATPTRVVSSLADADAIEIHAHGFVDQGVSDASLIALSPQADGRFALGAREIAGLRLTRSPLVILAACHAAYTAPYRHEPWGLPRAFLLAGARAVIASPDAISDAEAGELFRAVEVRILSGTDPAIALRDERARRLAAAPSSWVRAVLLFD
ncbi:MAG TPA: CHAT domain-containing protein [Kofleriaceae bacterium]|nr:CHAT domain-containing protein [Kofleriaceae bacterium]